MLNGNVRLRDKDGVSLSVPLEDLSENDQEWIRNRLATKTTKPRDVQSATQQKASETELDSDTKLSAKAGDTFEMRVPIFAALSPACVDDMVRIMDANDADGLSQMLEDQVAMIVRKGGQLHIVAVTKAGGTLQAPYIECDLTQDDKPVRRVYVLEWSISRSNMDRLIPTNEVQAASTTIGPSVSPPKEHSGADEKTIAHDVPVEDNRHRWVSETYANNAFVHVQGKRSAQVDANTQKTVYDDITEISRTSQYIELFFAARNETYRLSAKRMEVKRGQRVVMGTQWPLGRKNRANHHAATRREKAIAENGTGPTERRKGIDPHGSFWST